MEDSMYQRLMIASKRLKEIDEELASEECVKDIKHFREISKERAILDPQVEAFERYNRLVKELEEAKEMSRDSDSDIAEMGKEEINLIKRYTKLFLDTFYLWRDYYTKLTYAYDALLRLNKNYKYIEFFMILKALLSSEALLFKHNLKNSFKFFLKLFI